MRHGNGIIGSYLRSICGCFRFHGTLTAAESNMKLSSVLAIGFSGLFALVVTIPALALAQESNTTEAVPTPEPVKPLIDSFQSEPVRLPNIIPDIAVALISESDKTVKLKFVDEFGHARAVSKDDQIHIVRPDGTKRDLKIEPGQRSLVEFDAEPGIQAVVTLGPRGHVAVPFIVRQRKEGDVGHVTSTIEIPGFDIEPASVAMISNKYLGLNSSKRKREASELNDYLANNGRVVKSYMYRVYLGPNGEMVGQLFTLERPNERGAQRLFGHNVVIHRNGSPIAKTLTDREGRFSVEGLSPGKYGLVVAGSSGYSAFAFEALAAPEGQQVSGNRGNYGLARSSRGARRERTETFVSMTAQLVAEEPLVNGLTSGSILPAVTIPNPLVPTEFLMTGGAGAQATAGLAADAAGVGANELAAGASGLLGAGGGAFGGAAGAGGAAGGIAGGAASGVGGGLGGIASLGAVGAAMSSSTGSGRFVPQPATADGTN